MTTFCAACGNSMDGGRQFCRVCGRKLPPRPEHAPPGTPRLRLGRDQRESDRQPGLRSAYFSFPWPSLQRSSSATLPYRKFGRVRGGSREKAWPLRGWFSDTFGSRASPCS